MVLLEQFEQLTGHPKNAAKLKELVLQLAVQGKLTEAWRNQHPNVEPASELLKKIEAEKAQLVKEKKIRKEQPLETIQEEEITYDLPETWLWVRLGELGDWGAGATPSRGNSELYDGNINWYKSGELNNGIIDYDSEERITELALKKTSLRLNKPGDVLIAMYGATIGKTAILAVEGTTNQAVCACTCYSGLSNLYLHLLLKAYKSVFTDQGTGGAQPNISRIKIRTTPVPLPPLAEQEAIVARVEELMQKIEELEKGTLERIQLQKSLGEAALQALTTAPADELEQQWLFLKEHFQLLFTQEANVKKLRETILQLAVQGKLTSAWRQQNPTVQPAAQLLQQIQAEKAQLVKEKKIRKEESFYPLPSKEKLEVLPEGWNWYRFGELTINRDSERVPLSKSEREHRKGNFDYYGASGVIDKIDKYLFEKDLLLIGEDGANLINRSTPIAFIATGKYWVNNHAHVIDAIDFRILRYLEVYINSINLESYITGMAQPKMNQKYLNSIPVALPPLAEQEAIVAKVDQLMQMCDELENQLKQSNHQAEVLMQAVVQAALQPQEEPVLEA
ncbi:restriction endonuclease subunit S [Rufibacter quisquiliarum]|uniref:Type I restriction enzyme S subunit n=1 Tax=Rufibacter quisquiliarum TaxID=1549639 RepID=A0A839GGG3_9BACT|nr:restriction endonuclease subunit S [Rufibacter quisquiliarum]MBA9078754.1 type I restriction enzyme S subunit [Rufibacter quisquiliarum]